jgi:hypothetical protein
VLAANALMTALARCYEVGTNLVRAFFLDPRVRDIYEGWDEVTAARWRIFGRASAPTSTIQVGLLELPIPDTDHQVLAIYHARPGSRGVGARPAEQRRRGSAFGRYTGHVTAKLESNARR